MIFEIAIHQANNENNEIMLVHNFLEASASRLPDKVALIYGNKRLTYKQINSLSDHIAASLVGMGIKRQDRVVIFMDNSPESVISLFGILKADCTFVMLNSTMKAKKLNYILKDSGARAVITHRNKARVINEAIYDTADLDHIIWCIDSSEQKNIQAPQKQSTLKTSISWSSIFDQSVSLPAEKRPNSIDIDLATIIYTSGSTGEPKGVMSAHYNVAAAANSITTYLENTENDIIINTLPLSFDYGLYQVLMTFLFGGTIVLEKSFVYPYRIIEKLIKERVTGFPIVPTMAALLLQIDDLLKFDFSVLRYISNTAAPLPVPYIRKIQSIFPHVKIYSMYGLTECKRVSYLPPEDIYYKPDSVGVPMPNEEIFIVNEDGEEVGPNEVGELVVRGSNVMQGYWNTPEETALTFKQGRYRGDTLLYTGDLFRRDEEGYLYFVARRDDLIKTKGERVSPKEIEEALLEMDGILEAAIIGVPDEIYGQAIKAYIVTQQGIKITEEQVKKFCIKNLEPFMLPKYVEFRDSLPKSSSGKVDKKKLGQLPSN